MRGSFDQDALVASVDLIGRAGARNIEIGHLYDDEEPPPGWPEGTPVPAADAAWYAKAQWRGVVLMEDERRSPIEAVEALAFRVFAGAHCGKCRELIRLSDEEAGCRWRRMGDRWIRGCDGGAPSMAGAAGPAGNRKQRRRR